MTKAEILIPDHEGSFSIEHNPHRDCYEKATDYIREWFTPPTATVTRTDSPDR